MEELRLSDVIALVERALRAEIDVARVAELWPEPPADPYLAEVREDLEFALEHIPGRRPRNGPWYPVLEAWKQAPEYDDLQDHLSRLRALRESDA